MAFRCVGATLAVARETAIVTTRMNVYRTGVRLRAGARPAPTAAVKVDGFQ